MPKSIQHDLKKITKVIHPRSRKAQQLSKKISRISAREKIKLIHQVRQNLLGEKLQWFKDHLDSNVSCCTPEMLMELIERYIHRFDEELEQITLNRSIGSHRSRQHASREDIIRMTILKDQEDYETAGIELPDILTSNQLNLLRQWRGELRFLQKFRLRLFSKRLLTSLAENGTGSENLDSENPNASSENEFSTSQQVCDSPPLSKDDTPNPNSNAQERMDTDS